MEKFYQNKARFNLKDKVFPVQSCLKVVTKLSAWQCSMLHDEEKVAANWLSSATDIFHWTRCHPPMLGIDRSFSRTLWIYINFAFERLWICRDAYSSEKSNFKIKTCSILSSVNIACENAIEETNLFRNYHPVKALGRESLELIPK